jgi:hypothetical protein
MKQEPFKITKQPLEDLIELLVELYKRGYDYVDLSSDNSCPTQDKLLVFTEDKYLSPNLEYRRDFENEDDDEDEEEEFPKTSLKTKSLDESKPLSDDDINGLL